MTTGKTTFQDRDARPENILTRCLERIDMLMPAQRAFDMSPELHGISCRLAAFLSERPRSPFSSRSLLDISMEQALAAYFNQEPSGTTAEQRFVQALFNRATDILWIEVASSGETWNPLGGDSLSAFFQSNPSAKWSYRPVDDTRPSPKEYRRFLSNQLLTDHDISSMKLDVDVISNPPD